MRQAPKGEINKERTVKKNVLALFLVLALLLIPAVFTSVVLADDSDGVCFSVRTVTLDGTSIDEFVINGSPTPPPGFVRSVVSPLPEPNVVAGVNILSNVPAFNWSFGCSATSAAMIAGYYDRIGYGNMYAGPTNGGVMPMDNSSWPDWDDGHDDRHQCPLSATHNGLDGRTTSGHVDDYWIQYGSTAQDPFIGNWTEHTYGDCTGDYMKTNQYNYNNSDGVTTFWNYTNGAPLYDYQLEAYGAGYYDHDGGYGHKLFYESRGYTVTQMYNQYILGQGTDSALGFTYDQYKAEIDAGRPVMIHLEDHTVVGLGYDDATNLMYVHDTWDYSTHTMTWGESYSGMDHLGVTVVQLQLLPVITSCNLSGDEINQFVPGQSVYISGSGLEASTDYKIWIQDNLVTEWELLETGEDPSAVKGVLVTTDVNGNFGPTGIWDISPDATIDYHEYDIVVDKQDDGTNTGTFNSSSDGIDSINAVGFTAPVPELPAIVLLSLGLVVMAGFFLRSRMRDRTAF